MDSELKDIFNNEKITTETETGWNYNQYAIYKDGKVEEIKELYFTKNFLKNRRNCCFKWSNYKLY